MRSAATAQVIFLSWYFSAAVYFCMVLVIYIQKENSHLLTLRLGILIILE